MKSLLAKLGLLLALVPILLAGCGQESAPQTAAKAAPAEPNPLLVFGIDGATWDVIDPMIERGELPNFAALKARGASGSLITVGLQVSPVVWTSFATGHFGRKHGILDFVYPYQGESGRPVQSTERQVPALWNLASEAGRSVSATGYFVSFPAEEVNGAIVSYYSPQRQPGADYPEGVLEPIRDHLRTWSKEEKKVLWSRFLPWDFDPANPPEDSDPTAEAFRMVSGRVENRILHAEYNRRAALYLADTPRDLTIVYSALVDYASHSLWKYYDDSDFEEKADPESKRLLGNVIPESYRFMDELLGDLLSKMPENTNVLIVSDHGFGSATGHYQVRPEHKETLNGNHRPVGIFLAAGPDIVPGEIDRLTIMDVFPIMAYLSGVPVADDLPGDLDVRLFRTETLEGRPPVFVPNYASQAPVTAEAAEVSQQAQEENVKALQGLGYVGETYEAGESETGAYDFWAAKEELVIGHLVGEMTYFLLKTDEESVSEILSETRTHFPDMPINLLFRSKVALEALVENLGESAVPESSMAVLRDLIERERAMGAEG